MDLLERFPPQSLRQYAVIADGERGVLVGPHGDMAWLCAPSWESEGVFATLIGGQGAYSVTPAERFTWGGYYEPRSLIWTSRWVTADGIVESREALALPADPRVAVIVRRIRVLQGTVRLSVALDVRAGFGRQTMHDCRRHGSEVWTGCSGPITFRWQGAGAAQRPGSGPLELELTLEAGQEHDLVLELADGEPAGSPPPAEQLWSATAAAWADAVPDRSAGLAARDSERSLAVLVGLTSRSGGMVAAITSGLPERAPGGRNYDYRYAWIRDQCYAGIAASMHGQTDLLDAAVTYVADRVGEHGPDLAPAYTVSGEPVPGVARLRGLSGYPGSDAIVGNAVAGQFQLDPFGEALELFACAVRHDRLDRSRWDAVEAAVSAIEQRWRDADAGIWELDPGWWTHSRLAVVAGLRSVAAEARGDQAGRWSALADAVLAETSRRCLHPSGRWQQRPDRSKVDAALLLPAIRGALAPGDPRTDATVRAVQAELVRDGYVYRFRHDDQPLGRAEGSFLLCGFLLALALHQQGRPIEARAHFERSRSASGSPGLLAEEFDVDQRQLRGNLPQAFVHALLLQCSATLPADPPGGSPTEEPSDQPE